jgi:hypothetical protein
MWAFLKYIVLQTRTVTAREVTQFNNNRQQMKNQEYLFKFLVGSIKSNKGISSQYDIELYRGIVQGLDLEVCILPLPNEKILAYCPLLSSSIVHS